MITGIIYLAKNTISNKCYVGKTIRTLELRKREHFIITVKADYKFGKALQKYPESTWEWSILAEVPIEELNEYEKFFIKDLDTYKKGYNSHIGGDWEGEANPRIDTTIYELWHPEHGEIRETISELCKRHNSFSKHFSGLVSGKRKHINGYVLLENKDKYQEITKTYDFYHPEVGIITCTTKELFNNYRDYFKCKENQINILTSKKVLIHYGWVLAENKNRYEDITNRSAFVTLTHPEHGTLTLKRCEFKERFGLVDSGMTNILNGKLKHYKKWSLV